MFSSPRLSKSVEDYLKVIYLLSERGGPASTSDIADTLAVQPASVSGMIKRLAESGYLEHAPYRGVRLTGEGTREALRIVRRHRVIETYLHLRLGYSWEEVHSEAEALEHAATDELVDRMAAALENPSHDPHGAPIPTRAGEIEAVTQTTLAEASVGSQLRIQAVQDEDPDRLRYMEARGLLPGVRLTIEDRQPFDGPVTVRVGGSAGVSQVLGHRLAQRIYVAEAG
jgi:DtxR family Mn-dependent transcriptional regulator